MIPVKSLLKNDMVHLEHCRNRDICFLFVLQHHMNQPKLLINDPYHMVKERLHPLAVWRTVYQGVLM